MQLPGATAGLSTAASLDEHGRESGCAFVAHGAVDVVPVVDFLTITLSHHVHLRVTIKAKRTGRSFPAIDAPVFFVHPNRSAGEPGPPARHLQASDTIWRALAQDVLPQ